jgi:hypothetical protein
MLKKFKSDRLHSEKTAIAGWKSAILPPSDSSAFLKTCGPPDQQSSLNELGWKPAEISLPSAGIFSRSPGFLMAQIKLLIANGQSTPATADLATAQTQSHRLFSQSTSLYPFRLLFSRIVIQMPAPSFFSSRN